MRSACAFDRDVLWHGISVTRVETFVRLITAFAPPLPTSLGA
jgi:hypothetical protein